jgi:gliding motility-associated-like protein
MKPLIATGMFAFLLAIQPFLSQTMYTSGAQIAILNGAVFQCNGGFHINSSSQITNDGTLYVTRFSSPTLAGTIKIDNNSLLSGTGSYHIEQDWINNATFSGSSSTVELYGDLEQFITSDNGTITTFNNLQLVGVGTGINRRKSLLNVNSNVSPNGFLSLGDRELYTGTNTLTIENTDPASVQNSSIFGNEGFVSSLIPGNLIRNTNSQDSYLFPVGSSDGTLRYRPVHIAPNSSSNQEFAVRFNNYNSDNDGYLVASHENSISQANTLFYHSIERLSGTSSSDIQIDYIPANDGNWNSLADWHSALAMWRAIGITSSLSASNYASISKISWDFSNNTKEYILTNLIDNIVIPSGFTPNGDGTNDQWDLLNLDQQYPENEVRIFNRWGELLFEHNSSKNDPYSDNPWDGKFQGEQMPVGSYYYIINLNDTDKTVKNGVISIIKK